jgi:pimeloyl-ACP methyl ester carboxylesterase
VLEAHDPTEEAALDAALADFDWSLPPTGSVRGTFDAPSGRLATLAMGDPTAPPVLLAPGVTGSKEDFSLMLPLLAAAGYYAISYDLAGQYESADAGPEHLTPPSKHYNNELFVDDFVAILESLGAPAHVLGYSYAGIIAQLVLARRPELIASLTLLSAPPEPGQTFRGMSGFGPISGLAPGGVGASFMIWGNKLNYTKVQPGRLRFIRRRFDFTRVSSVRDIIALMKKTPDVRAEVRAAAIPKLVAVGVHDLWPLGLHKRFADEIGADFSIYQTGHSPCETTPHQLVRDLLKLYARAS